MNSSSTSAQADLQPSQGKASAPKDEQLALPLTDRERAASRKQIEALHPANRFRLMFGRPFLQGDATSGQSR